MSFTWGAVRLWYVMYQSINVEELEDYEWTFGQVMPLVLLAAPIFTMLEGFSKGEAATTSTACSILDRASIIVFSCVIQIQYPNLIHIIDARTLSDRLYAGL